MASLTMQLLFVQCLVFVVSCKNADEGQFYKLTSGEPDTNEVQYLNEEYFECGNAKSCFTVSKKKAETTQVWKKDNGKQVDYSKNIARGRQTAQTTIKDGTPYSTSSKAVDGNKNGNYFARSCSSTETIRGQWWMVDFGRTAVVYSVNITNRSDCCEARLRDFSIRVDGIKNEVTNLFCRKNVGMTKQGTANFKCDQIVAGRYLYVITNIDEGVTLCEVEVFGTYL